MSVALRIVATNMPDRGGMFYLVDGNDAFISKVKEFFDRKTATNRAQATMQAYYSRSSWYYRFLAQLHASLLEATPANLTECVIWLCNPYRDVHKVSPIYQPYPIVEVHKSSTLATCSTSYFAKNAHANCGKWTPTVSEQDFQQQENYTR